MSRTSATYEHTMRIRRKAEVDSSDTCWSCESPLTEGAWLVEESEGKGEPIHTTWLGCESCTRFIYEENPLKLYVDTGEELIHLPLEDLTRFALAIADVKDIPPDQQCGLPQCLSAGRDRILIPLRQARLLEPGVHQQGALAQP